MTDVYKKIRYTLFIVISLFSGLSSAKDTMIHDAFTYRYSDPYLAIDLLEQSDKISDINNAKETLDFENYELLIHLYLKTEQHQNDTPRETSASAVILIKLTRIPIRNISAILQCSKWPMIFNCCLVKGNKRFILIEA